MRIPASLVIVFILTFCTATYGQRAAIDSLKKVLVTADDTSKPFITYLLGKKYLRVSSDTSRMYTKMAIVSSQKENNQKVLAESYSILGALDKYQGNYETSLTHHLNALKIKEQLDDDFGLTVTYNDLGILYKNMKRWREALGYYRKSNERAKKIDMGRAISFTYNNLGTVYNELHQPDSAMQAYDSALYYAEKINNTTAMSTALANIADVQFVKGKYTEALNSFKRCLQYDKQNEDKYGMALSHMQLGRTYSVLNNLSLAKKHIDTADLLSEQEHLLRERINILMIKSSIQEKMNDVSDAILSIRQSASLKDSLLNEQTSRQISELQTQYETEKKEQQIALQQAELSKKNTIIAGILSLLILFTLLGYSYYRRYKLKQQDKLQKTIIKQQELATQAVLEAEERERKRIASDLHDGVGQTMSAAKLNLSTISSEIPFANNDQKNAFEKAMALVDEGCAEVRTVSHNIMPNALLKAGLATAVRDFLNKIDGNVINVNLYVEGLTDRLPGNIESVLYRVIQECVNNVVKHAHANSLDITLIKDQEELNVTIEDNGKGFELDTALKKDGIGLQNLITRINFLKGTIEWDTAPGRGTVVMINIPSAKV